MTIQDLGSLGELIAAVATLVTLIYLALQIRANTRVASAEASRASRGASNRANLAVAQDKELARIFLTGLGDPAKGAVPGGYSKGFREYVDRILAERPAK